MKAGGVGKLQTELSNLISEERFQLNCKDKNETRNVSKEEGERKQREGERGGL